MTNSAYLLRLPRTHVPRYSQSLVQLLAPAGSATETLWHVYNRLFALPSTIVIYSSRHATKLRRHGNLSPCSTLTSVCRSLPQNAPGHWRCSQVLARSLWYMTRQSMMVQNTTSDNSHLNRQKVYTLYFPLHALMAPFDPKTPSTARETAPEPCKRTPPSLWPLLCCSILC